MPENRIIKYHYNNKKLSKAAVGHIFRYLSAMGGCRFVEDRESAVVWRDEGQTDLPATALISFGDGENDSETSIRSRNGLYISPDTVEKIYEKISLRVTLGPYSEKRHRPDNRLEESLGRTILDLLEKLRNAGVYDSPGNTLSLWPGDHKFALALTHDVDIIRRSVPGSVRLMFKKDVPGGLGGLIDSFKSITGPARNPYDKIREWIDHENRYDIKSTFFVFPGNRKNKKDPKYGLDGLRESFEYIKESNCRLALHTGIECHRGGNMEESRELLDRAAGVAVRGIRAHYLSARLPEYWRKAAESGFAYSSCLGFDEDVGFYQGIDLPFMPFDSEKDIPLNIVEIPIGIMDCGLINNDNKDIGESLEAGKKIVDRVKKTAGILVLDWHQRTMYNTDYPDWAKTCFDLIDYARKEGAYLTTMEDVAGLLKSRMAGRY